jgi:hypothetical protein
MAFMSLDDPEFGYQLSVRFTSPKRGIFLTSY